MLVNKSYPMRMNTLPSFSIYNGLINNDVNIIQSDNAIERAMLVATDGTRLDDQLDGELSGGTGVVRKPTVALHDPTHTSLATLNPFGICLTDNPYNIPAQGDALGRIDVSFDDPFTVIAGHNRPVSVAYAGRGASGGACLVRLWDTLNNVEYKVKQTDMYKPVYASRTSGNETGKAGYLCISFDTADDVVEKARVGIIVGLPQVDTSNAYVHFTGAEWVSSPGDDV